MGFYGDITNTARTQFNFDIVYPSRTVMDQNCSSDGVYAGRYVLVEYETDYAKKYPWEDEKKYYYYDGTIYTKINSSNDAFTGINKKFAIYAEENKIIIPNGNINEEESKGTFFVKIPVGNFFTYINTTEEYIRLEEKISQNQFYFSFITKEEYTSYWNNIEDTARAADRASYSVIEDNDPKHMIATIVPVKGEEYDVGACLPVPANYGYKAKSEEAYLIGRINTEKKLVWTEVEEATEQLKVEGKTSIELISAVNNFIDQSTYGSKQNYDSTVWMKVYNKLEDTTEGSPNQGKYEKYIKIADLNTVPPTFDIAHEAPQQIPVVPRVDEDSTNAYYKINMPSQWSIRTKASRPTNWGPEINSKKEINEKSEKVVLSTDSKTYPSDQNTSWSGEFYEDGEFKKKYYSAEKETWVDEKAEIPAAIYFNKDGFDPNKVSYESNEKDSIKLEPTGLSGQTYKDTMSGAVNDYTAQPDTQELSIMLPSLGNTISKIWDIVYGGKDTNESISKTGKRNLDIQWENAKGNINRKGLRLVKENAQGDGYTLAAGETGSEVNTLAGCINSVHDLMGMIIEDSGNNISAANIKNLDENKIYYTDGVFKRKRATSNYEPVETYEYSKADSVDELTYVKNYYYLDNSGKTVATAEYNKDATYYIKKLPDNYTNSYDEIDLMKWQPSTYYYKTSNGDYLLDLSSIATESSKYYSLKDASNPGQVATFTDVYSANKFYTYNSDYSTYSISTDETANSNTTYYLLSDIKQVNLNMEDDKNYNSDKKTYNEERLKYFYFDDMFYYNGYNAQGELDTTTYLKLNKKDLTVQVDSKNKLTFTLNGKNIQPLIIKLKASDNGSIGGTYVQDKNGNYVQTSLDSNTIIGYEVDLYQFEEEKYYYQIGITKQYRKLTEEVLAEQYAKQFNDEIETDKFYKYFSFNVNVQDAFYIPNTYWYYDANNGYVKDNSEDVVENRVYYTSLNMNLVNSNSKRFYIPNKYYYYDADFATYVLDFNLNKQDNTKYYIRNGLYVYEDTSGIYLKGAEWTSTGSAIPATVTLGKTKTEYELVELEGFARTLNTIHGLILKINQFMDFGNYSSRDLSTVQGTLNTLNDYVRKFKNINANGILFTDGYGQIVSGDLDSKQQLAIRNLGDEESSVVDENAKWIATKMDINSGNPSLNLQHNYYPQNDTESETSLNKLKIYTPIIDNTGHVVAKDVKTVLPSSITVGLEGKTTEVKASADDTTFDIKTDEVINITAQSKADESGEEKGKYGIQVEHRKIDQQFYAASPYGAKAANPNTIVDETMTLSIPTNITLDEYGHVLSAEKQDLTFAKGFSKFKINNLDDNSKIVELSSASNDGIQLNLSTGDNLEAETSEERLNNIPKSLSINLKHTAPGEEALSTNAAPDLDSESVKLEFNSQLKIPTFGIDGNGHVISIKNQNYTLPSISLVEDTEDDRNTVLTGKNGESLTYKSISNLRLSNYSIVNSLDSEGIQSSDTINTAFNKIETKLIGMGTLGSLDRLKITENNFSLANEEDYYLDPLTEDSDFTVIDALRNNYIARDKKVGYPAKYDYIGGNYYNECYTKSDSSYYRKVIQDDIIDTSKLTAAEIAEKKNDKENYPIGFGTGTKDDPYLTLNYWIHKANNGQTILCADIIKGGYYLIDAPSVISFIEMHLAIYAPGVHILLKTHTDNRTYFRHCEVQIKNATNSAKEYAAKEYDDTTRALINKIERNVDFLVYDTAYYSNQKNNNNNKNYSYNQLDKIVPNNCSIELINKNEDSPITSPSGGELEFDHCSIGLEGVDIYNAIKVHKGSSVVFKTGNYYGRVLITDGSFAFVRNIHFANNEDGYHGLQIQSCSTVKLQGAATTFDARGLMGSKIANTKGFSSNSAMIQCIDSTMHLDFANNNSTNYAYGIAARHSNIYTTAGRWNSFAKNCKSGKNIFKENSADGYTGNIIMCRKGASALYLNSGESLV